MITCWKFAAAVLPAGFLNSCCIALAASRNTSALSGLRSTFGDGTSGSCLLLLTL